MLEEATDARTGESEFNTKVKGLSYKHILPPFASPHHSFSSVLITA